jgi:xanthine/uracil permease
MKPILIGIFIVIIGLVLLSVIFASIGWLYYQISNWIHSNDITNPDFEECISKGIVIIIIIASTSLIGYMVGNMFLNSIP